MSRQLEPFPVAPSEPDSPADPTGKTAPDNGNTGHRNRTLVITSIVVILVLLAAGGGGWYEMHRMQQATVKKPAQSANSASGIVQPAPGASSASTMSTYNAAGSDLNLTFSYPNNWTVSPASGSDNSNQPITITTPPSNISGTTSPSGADKVIIQIRPAGSQIGELSSGNATVAVDSSQIAYSKPTSSQHQYPYVTFVHILGGTNPTNSFEELFVTGISSYMKGQTITSDNFTQLDPIISAEFYQCKTSGCDGPNATPLSISSATWQSDPLCQLVLGVIESLQLH